MSVEVVVDPYVALSILDHHQRRKSDEAQVRGLVTGSLGKGVIRVTNFVPMMQDPAFADLTLRSCPSDQILGWYATDPTLTSEADMAPATTLMVAVHTPTEEDPSVDVRAFQVQKVNVDGHEVRAFRPVACRVEATSAPGAVAVDAILRQIDAGGAAASDPSAVSAIADDNEVFVEFQQLRRNLNAASQYCERVAAGQAAGDAELGRKLSSTLLADLNQLLVAPTIDRDIETTTQDSLMLSFITKLLARKVTELRRTYHEQLEALVGTSE